MFSLLVTSIALNHCNHRESSTWVDGFRSPLARPCRMVEVDDGCVVEGRVGVWEVVAVVDGEERVGAVGVRVRLRVGQQQVRLRQVVHVQACTHAEGCSVGTAVLFWA